MELKSWHQALQAFAERQPDMTDDETGEMLGVHRPIISEFCSDCARYEQPINVKVQRRGRRWTRPSSTGVAC